MMSRYIPPAVSMEEVEQLRAKVAANEDELCRIYALLWHDRATLDEAYHTISELMTTTRTQQCELEALRAAIKGQDRVVNSPL